MFKLGVSLLLTGCFFSYCLPPVLGRWEKRDWLSTFPFISGILLCLLSVFVYLWKVLP